MSVTARILATFTFVVIAVGLPALMISGWIAWLRRKQPVTVSSILSTIGFTLGSASLLLAVGTGVYAHAVGGFPYYDPVLLRIYRVGIALSIAALSCSFGGFWYPSAVRRHALILSAGISFYWFFAALSE